MAKIKEIDIPVTGITKPVVVTIRYFSEQSERFFLIVPNDPVYLLPEHEMVRTAGRGRVTYRGIAGDTEESAINAFKAYMEEYVSKNSTRKDYIFLKVPDAVNRGGYKWNAIDEEKDVHTEVSLAFEYTVAYSIEVNSQHRYYKNGQYHNEARDTTIHSIDSYTIIPYSKQAVERCENIILQIEAMAKKLQELFKDPVKAESILKLDTRNLLTD